MAPANVTEVGSYVMYLDTSGFSNEDVYKRQIVDRPEGLTEEESKMLAGQELPCYLITAPSKKQMLLRMTKPYAKNKNFKKKVI